MRAFSNAVGRSKGAVRQLAQLWWRLLHGDLQLPLQAFLHKYIECSDIPRTPWLTATAMRKQGCYEHRNATLDELEAGQVTPWGSYIKFVERALMWLFGFRK